MRGRVPILSAALTALTVLGACATATPADTPADPAACEAAARTTTGKVTLRFDVTPGGAVENVRAVSATDPCFVAAAVEAARRWRYAPKVVDGRPVAQRGVETVLRFDPAPRD